MKYLKYSYDYKKYVYTDIVKELIVNRSSHPIPDQCFISTPSDTTSENLWFSDVFGGEKKITLTRNVLPLQSGEYKIIFQTFNIALELQTNG